jgi:hypothetical protein
MTMSFEEARNRVELKGIENAKSELMRAAPFNSLLQGDLGEVNGFLWPKSDDSGSVLARDLQLSQTTEL